MQLKWCKQVKLSGLFKHPACQVKQGKGSMKYKEKYVQKLVPHPVIFNFRKNP